MDKEQQQKIEQTLAQISKRLDGYVEEKYLASEHVDINHSLLGEFGGILLFQLHYMRWTGKAEKAAMYMKMIELTFGLVAQNQEEIDPSYADGLAGFGWLIQLLLEEEFIDGEVSELLAGFDAAVFAFAKNQLDEKNNDPLYGYVGAAMYFVGREDAQSVDRLRFILEKMFPLFTQKEVGLTVYEGLGLKANVPNLKEDERVSNFGMAHGLPGLLVLLSRCYGKAGLELFYDEIKIKVAGVIDFLLAHKNDEEEDSIFPNAVVEGREEESQKSRLAWCYGDLSVALALLKAGQVFDHADWLKEAGEIALHSSKRRSEENTVIKDAGFCHGASGLLSIFQYFYEATKQEAFKEAADFWMTDVLRKKTYTDSATGYKYFVARSKESDWHEDFSLIFGTGGMGLSLLNAIEGERKSTNWLGAFFIC